MLICTVDHQGFNAGLRGLARHVRGGARVVVAKEMGELVKTLVAITPPKEPSKTRASIADNISRRFEALGERQGDYESFGKKAGRTGIKWYAASSKYLFGVAPDSDMRKADPRTLLGIYYRTKSVQRHTRIVLPFKNRNTRQRVAIIARVLTQKKQINALITRISKHVGRLKAAWLPCVRDGVIPIAGGRMPPGWVTRHLEGARGSYVNGLGMANNPWFRISNFGKGAGKQFNNWIISSALNIRAKAMRQNLKLMLGGRKKLSTYGLTGAAYYAAK